MEKRKIIYFEKENCTLTRTQRGNCCNLVSHIFGKNFVKVTVLLNTNAITLKNFVKSTLLTTTTWKSRQKHDHTVFTEKITKYSS